MYGGCKLASELVVTWDDMCKVRPIYDLYVSSGLAGDETLRDAAQAGIDAAARINGGGEINIPGI
jgi:hypothetical protein